MVAKVWSVSTPSCGEQQLTKWDIFQSFSNFWEILPQMVRNPEDKLHILRKSLACCICREKIVAQAQKSVSPLVRACPTGVPLLCALKPLPLGDPWEGGGFEKWLSSLDRGILISPIFAISLVWERCNPQFSVLYSIFINIGPHCLSHCKKS